MADRALLTHACRGEAVESSASPRTLTLPSRIELSFSLAMPLSRHLGRVAHTDNPRFVMGLTEFACIKIDIDLVFQHQVSNEKVTCSRPPSQEQVSFLMVVCIISALG